MLTHSEKCGAKVLIFFQFSKYFFLFLSSYLVPTDVSPPKDAYLSHFGRIIHDDKARP